MTDTSDPTIPAAKLARSGMSRWWPFSEPDDFLGGFAVGAMQAALIGGIVSLCWLLVWWLA